MQKDIILSTLNSRYQHSAFGLRYLYANLGDLQERAQILEFTITQRPIDIAEKLLLQNPKILGLGIYIWNARESLELVTILKELRPELVIVLGGPEVSYENQNQSIVTLADYTVEGEGDFQFRELCKNIMEQIESPKIWKSKIPDIHQINLPYSLYSSVDIKNRVIYVEASRGCPYKCEYCLSSLDLSVRNFPLENFLLEIQKLLSRGARSFKFVDRTFNLSPSISTKILDFFLDNISLGLFLHFEMVPDRLPEELRDRIKKFPKGSLQFEIGVQTWNPEVSARVSRRQNYEKLCENLKFLREETSVHTHVDLIAGLPGETLESFAMGFDKLYSLRPDEIQLGILKRLRGAPISRHSTEWQMRYSPTPPYTILENSELGFTQIQELARFSRHWDMIANSGNFLCFMEYFYSKCREENQSLFYSFKDLSSYLYERHGETQGIALLNLLESIWEYSKVRNFDLSNARKALIEDYCERGARSLPRFFEDKKGVSTEVLVSSNSLSKRQSRHLKQ